MAGCSNCDSSFCSCVVQAGAGNGTVNVAVTGSGDADDPYIVSATVNLCEAAGNLADGGVAVAGTDRVMVIDGTTCTIKTLPVGGGGGDEHYTVTGVVNSVSGLSPVLPAGGPYLMTAVIPQFAINNPSATRPVQILLMMASQGSFTVAGLAQQTGEVEGDFVLNGVPNVNAVTGYAGVNEVTGLVANGNSFYGSYRQSHNIAPGGSALVGDLETRAKSFIQNGSGQLIAACSIAWTGGTNP